MKCPGQDTRYWGDDAAFEVPCPKCGRSVEIFKDESSAKCTGCEHRFRNPKVDLKCAEWCAYAKECLGFAVSTVKSANLGEGALASRLIQVVKEEFAEDQSRITRTLMAFQHAKELASSEGGDARVVMAAVLLLEVVGRNSGEEEKAGEIEGPVEVDLARPKRILDEGEINGKELTKNQKSLYSMIASGKVPMSLSEMPLSLRKNLLKD